MCPKWRRLELVLIFNFCSILSRKDNTVHQTRAKRSANKGHPASRMTPTENQARGSKRVFGSFSHSTSQSRKTCLQICLSAFFRMTSDTCDQSSFLLLPDYLHFILHRACISQKTLLSIMKVCML